MGFCFRVSRQVCILENPAGRLWRQKWKTISTVARTGLWILHVSPSGALHVVRWKVRGIAGKRWQTCVERRMVLRNSKGATSKEISLHRHFATLCPYPCKRYTTSLYACSRFKDECDMKIPDNIQVRNIHTSSSSLPASLYTAARWVFVLESLGRFVF